MARPLRMEYPAAFHNPGREMAVYLARQHSGRPLTEIGGHFLPLGHP